MPPFDDLKVLSGNAHVELANDICKYLGTSLASSEAFKFSNDNTFVRIKENILIKFPKNYWKELFLVRLTKEIW